MLNERKERELCYVARVDDIRPIEDRDRVECAVIGGWTVMVRKGQFHPGDLGIYFEVDAKVPEKEPFLFLAAKKYKIKIQKYGNFYSQGLLMSAEDFGWTKTPLAFIEKDDTPHYVDDETRFLTKRLGVIYEVPEDNERKAPSVDQHKKMAQRHSKLFARFPFNWLMRRNWGKKLLFIFFGKKKDSKTAFPTKFPYIKKTDEERIESIPQLLLDKRPWVKTQKIDGSSASYILDRKKFEKYVCSRNVRQLTPSQKNYHTEIEGNIYWMMAEKYHIFEFLQQYLIENNLDYVGLQGEVAGPNIQGNPHKFKENCFFGYNLIRSDTGRVDTISASRICEANGIPWVPIADTAYILPDDMETIKRDADGPCIVGEGMREGWVCRSQDGKQSFKNVSREYLLKH